MPSALTSPTFEPFCVQEAKGGVEMVDGYTLLRSHRSSTGYRGVTQTGEGRFKAIHSRHGGMRNIGSYGTAVEAAVAYAKYVASGVRAQDEREEVVGGYSLKLSRTSSTGYLGVRRHEGRFRVVVRNASGKNIFVGRSIYDTAVEAAVARAKHLAGDTLEPPGSVWRRGRDY